MYPITVILQKLDRVSTCAFLVKILKFIWGGRSCRNVIEKERDLCYDDDGY